MKKIKKIATYTEPGLRLQLIENYTIYLENKKYVFNYIILKNRKIIKKSTWESIARNYFYDEIKNHLLQLKLL